MVVLSSLTNPLAINTAWDHHEVDSEVHRLFGDPMTWLENHRSDDNRRGSLWRGAIAHKGNLTLGGDVEPTGVELIDYFKLPGRPIADRILYFGAKFLFSGFYTASHLSSSSSMQNAHSRTSLGLGPVRQRRPW